jgi:hypothetical protein
MRRWLGIIVLLVVACSAKMGEPDLIVTVSPNTLTGAQTGQVEVVATNADTSVGKGTVHVVSGAGSLSSGVDVTLDAYGTAHVDFTCDPTVDSACSAGENVTATWTPAGLAAVTAMAHVTAGHAGTGGGGGGSGGGSGHGVTVIDTPCTASTPPGLDPTCCVPDAGLRSGAVGCGWTKVKLPASVAVSFGQVLPHGLYFPGPSTFVDYTACTMWGAWGGQNSDGGVSNVVYSVTTYGVSDAGDWLYIEGGSAQSVADPLRLCADYFKPAASAGLVNVIGQMTLDGLMNGPDEVYFFSLHH